MWQRYIILPVAAAIFAFVLTRGFREVARRVRAVDQPTGERKIHMRPTPLLGGLGIIFAIIIVMTLGISRGWLIGDGLQEQQLIGFVIATLLIVIVGMLDDCFGLSPALRFFVYILACVVILMSGTRIMYLTNWFGSEPWSLVWKTWSWHIGSWKGVWIFPADALTMGWLLSVTFATKFLDGVDGLVSGQTVIGAGLIAALSLSSAFYQPIMALFALVIGAGFLGFLPWNVHPAKQFLGESGSVFAGFGLGFLAIVSGAKLAVSLMALGVPLADAFLVLVGRLKRRQPLWEGDDTHLHFRLLRAGLTPRQTVAIMWCIAFVFGVAALGVQSRGKLFLLLMLVVLTGWLSVFSRMKER